MSERQTSDMHACAQGDARTDARIRAFTRSCVRVCTLAMCTWMHANVGTCVHPRECVRACKQGRAHARACMLPCKAHACRKRPSLRDEVVRVDTRFASQGLRGETTTHWSWGWEVMNYLASRFRLCPWCYCSQSLIILDARVGYEKCREKRAWTRQMCGGMGPV